MAGEEPTSWNRKLEARDYRSVGLGVLLVAAGWVVLKLAPRPYYAIAIVGGLELLRIASAFKVSWRNLRSRTYRPLPRLTEMEAQGFLVWQWLYLAILGILWSGNHWNLESVGLRPDVPGWIGLLAGFALYLPLNGAVYVIRRWRYGAEASAKSWIRSMKRFFPRTARGRWLVRFGVLLVPLVEEVSHRGILVVQLARETGHLLPAVALGLGVAVALHLYQGPTQVLFHAAFAGLAIAIALSPLGLWGAIGLHVAGDLIPFARFPGAFAALTARRAARSRAVPAGTV